jgi:hypothetical protein
MLYYARMRESVEQTTQTPGEQGAKATPALEQSANTLIPARPAETINILTHGWKAYAAEQVSSGRWTQEQLTHPEQKLLPEMKSYEIRQGIREGIITDPKAVSLMFEKDLQETRHFWNEWHASHAAERDDAANLAAISIAAKEEELQPLLKSPTRQAEYLATQAERALHPEDDIPETLASRNQQEAANLFDMAARLARLASQQIEQKIAEQQQEQQAAQVVNEKEEAIREELAALEKKDEQPTPA